MTEPTLHTQQIQAPSTDQFEKLTAKQQRFHLRLDLSRRALQGESIRVESYLEMYPALEQNSEALLDLLESEISIRTGQGERVELRELQERFPHLGATISGLMAPVSVDPESGTLPPPDPEACCETGTVLPTAKEMIKVSAPVKREIANYEILGELGRGGMGVVYKARQKGLNRLVALKMILHADHAGSDERMRFEREAQAIARLDHPNIVQVHEIGEHEGKPFFSLEFVTGGALDKKLDGKPLPMEESATLVETLARGMHAAHQADVIHRDLKPANVLITEGGVPKITDFGLAKNLDEAGQTQSGAIMGTPSYMAPEQAAGKTQLVGPGVDVYALGAILYECLTGQPPFRAATAMDTVLQVLSQLPVPPSQIREGIPKDLETVCLKCLEKEPSKRYETAELLAEDLRRFQNHEPISARPVGRGEKLWRWCKRNPAVASLLTLVVLVLMAGTTVSSILAVKARVEADNARKSQRKATEREKEANQARADLEKTNKELTSSVARSLARPLISEIPLGKPIPLLKDPEREALRELMMTRSEDLRLAFIQESLQTPVKARQLRLRAKEALRAAVGVSPSRLRVAEQSLLKKLKQQTISEEQRADVAIIALHLGPLSSETVQEAVVPVIQVMSRAVDHHELKPLSDSLSALASRMGPKEAARVAAFLLQVISKTTDRRPLHSLSLSLSALASRVEPKEAVAILTQAMGKTHNPSLPRPLPTIPRPLHEGLSAVASRMESKEAAATLIQAMGKVTDSYALRSFSTSLSSIASRLKPEEAAQTAAMLTQAMRKTTESRVLHYLSEGLVSVGIRMEPKGAVTTLTQVLSQTIGSTALRTLSKGLSSLASRMGPEEAAQLAATLTQTMGKTTESFKLFDLSQGLSSVALRMEPGKAATTLTQAMSKTTDYRALRFLSAGLSSVAKRMVPHEAAATLAQVMSKATDHQVLQSLSEALTSVAGRMDPKEATQVCSRASTTLTRAMGRTTDFRALRSLFEALSSVAGRMAPKDATQVCSKAAIMLTQAMRSTTNYSVLEHLSRSLSSVALRMAPKDAAQLAATLTQAMSKTTGSGALYSLSVSLSTVAGRMDPKEATQACSRAATILIQAMSKTTSSYSLQSLSKGLASVATGMMPEEATQIAVTLTRALSNSRPTAQKSLSDGLCSVASRMKPEEAAAILIGAMGKTTYSPAVKSLTKGLSSVVARMKPEAAAAALTQAMIKTSDYASLRALSETLSSLASRMEPEKATRFCSKAVSPLTQAMSKTNDYRALQSLSESLSSVASRMDSDEAARACSKAVIVLTQSMRKHDHFARQSLSLGLSAVAVRMHPKEAAAILTRAISNTTDPASLRSLSLALSAVASRMEPKGAAQVCSKAAATINKAMGKETGSGVLWLSQGLSAVAGRMEPGEAAQVCSKAAATLTQAMSKTTYPASLRSLSQGLSVLASRMEPGETARACSHVAAFLTDAMSRTTDPRRVGPLSQCLSTVLAKIDLEGVSARRTNVARAVAAFAQPGQFQASLVLLRSAMKLLPCRLTTQQLVDLLKLYTCTGKAERVILDQLQSRYGEKFADRWDFVAYAQKHKLELDFNSPPELSSTPVAQR